MKYYIGLILSITLIYPCLCQKANQMLIPFEIKGQWGYMNHEKKIVVVPQYDEAFPTYGQMGRVRKNGKYGFINSLGEVIIKLKYDSASDYKFGYITVVKNNKKKYLNPQGKINTAFPGRCGTGSRYLDLSSDIPFLIKGENNKYGFLLKKRFINEDKTISLIPDTLYPIFDTVVSLANQSMYVIKGGKIAFTNSSYYSAGSKIILDKMNFKYDEIRYFTHEDSDKIHYIIGIKENDRWGYYDVLRELQGKEIVEPKYYSITSMEKDYALIEYEPNRYGYIDRTGKEYFWRGQQSTSN